MGIAIIPAASAAGKTEFVTTLTSGTSWTVPTGVNYINVILTGGGGGGPFSSYNQSLNANAGSGGTTTFTGATSAAGGGGGISNLGGNSSPPDVQFNGSAGIANSGGGGFYSFHGPSSIGSNSSRADVVPGKFAQSGQTIASTLSTTPGSTINYAIGAGGNAAAGFAANSGQTFSAANPGGSGKVEIHYWV
jgi:hypothetical protein